MVLAKIAYEAYRQHTGGKSLATGQDIPEFEKLSPAIQEAWNAAANAIDRCPRSGVRAKFICERVEASMGSKAIKDPDGKTQYVPAELRTIQMRPVFGNGDPAHENTKFWQASPSGQLVLGVINEGAWPHFKLGQEYYLDFTATDSVPV